MPGLTLAGLVENGLLRSGHVISCVDGTDGGKLYLALVGLYERSICTTATCFMSRRRLGLLGRPACPLSPLTGCSQSRRSTPRRPLLHDLPRWFATHRRDLPMRRDDVSIRALKWLS